jgi:hypothetical protein
MGPNVFGHHQVARLKCVWWSPHTYCCSPEKNWPLNYAHSGCIMDTKNYYICVQSWAQMSLGITHICLGKFELGKGQTVKKRNAAVLLYCRHLRPTAELMSELYTLPWLKSWNVLGWFWPW